MIRQQLIYLLDELGLTYQELAEQAEIPVETMRNIYYGKTKDPKVSTIFAIAKALQVSVNRLMGEGMLTEQEEELIMNFRKCGKHGKSMIMLTASYEAELSRHERDATNKFTIPCIVPLDVIHDGLNYSSSEMIDIATDNPDAYIAIQITSNDFTPVFCKGDQMLLTDRFPVSGETAVFFIDNMVYCRKFKEVDNGFILESLNRHGKNFTFKRMDKVKCMGTCIGVIRA